MESWKDKGAFNEKAAHLMKIERAFITLFKGMDALFVYKIFATNFLYTPVMQ